MEGEASSKAAEAVIQTLKARGWCIGDTDQVKALTIIHSALSDDGDTRTIADSVELELLNMDLRSIGAKSLPDQTLLRRTAHLQGPKILQIAFVRDISVSSMEGFSDSPDRRLLKLVLTDGHSEITAIEYSHIKSIPNDIVPGTKVRLESKVPLHSSIACLSPAVITVIGGVVQSLYDEWQMNRKYSGFSRSSVRVSKETGDGGSCPPPFEKLQVGAPLRQHFQRGGHSDSHASTSKSSTPTGALTPGNIERRQADRQRKVDDVDDKVKAVSIDENIKQSPGPTETRQKEVAESVPIQNQAASQKLLQKMNQPNHGNQHFKGRRHRGKGREEEEEEQHVLTLDEWEKKRAGAKPPIKTGFPDTTSDEDLARKLQHQLDMEDSHVQQRAPNTVADDLKRSMFSFEKDSNGAYEGEYGGRGRGRGRGKGRGTGRGRGRRRGGF